MIEIPDLARDPGLLCDTDALGVDVVGQASRAVSRGTLDSSVPQVVKSTRFCSRVYHRFALMEKDGTFIKQPYPHLWVRVIFAFKRNFHWALFVFY